MGLLPLTLYGFYLWTLYEQHKLPAIDFGVFVTATRDYGLFRAPKAQLFGDWIGDWRYAHFSIAPMLAAPLGWLFQGRALLIVSWMSVVVGALGVWRYAMLRFSSQILAALPPVAFLSFFAIPFTLSVGYVDNLPGIAAIPWLFVAWHKANDEKRQGKASFIAWAWVVGLAIFIALCKEHLGLLVAMLGLTLSVPANYRLSAFRWKSVLAGLGLCMAGLGLYLLITKLVIPHYAPESHTSQGYLQVKVAYSSLFEGKGREPGLLGFLNALWESADLRLAYLFGDPYYQSTPDSAFAHAKPELWNCLWMGIGGCLFLLPRWWPPFALVLAWKLLANDPVRWGVGHQYAIELAPLAALAFVDFLALLQKSRFALPRVIAPIVGVALLVLTFQTTRHITTHRLSPWSDSSQEALFTDNFWKPTHSYVGVKKMLKLLPKDAAVSATTRLCPQLAWRDAILEFPSRNGCDYIALDLLDPQPYPFPDTASRRRVSEELAGSPEWKVVFEEEGALLLKRREFDNHIISASISHQKQKGQ